MQRQIVPVVPSLKRLKHKTKLSGTKPYRATLSPPPVHIIKAIPMIQVNVHNSAEEKQRLRVKGYKYLSKLTASGEFVKEKLRGIKGSLPLKMINKFEFDAFLSNHSAIRPLLEAFKKLRMTKNFYLVIRRVDTLNESNKIYPFLLRMMRMKKIQIEFPSTDNIDGRSIRQLASTLTRCGSLEYLKQSYIYLPKVSSEDFTPIFKRLFTLKRVKEAKLEKLCNEMNFIQAHADCAKLNFSSLPRLESMSVKKGFKQGWTELSSGEEEELPYHLEKLLYAINLRRISWSFERYAVSSQFLLFISKVLPKFQALECISLEFLSCKLEELEFMILVLIAEQATQIKRLRYIITQNPNVQDEHVVQFAKRISRLRNLEKFDVYFRGTNLRDAESIMDQVSRMENIQYSFTQNSVHFSRGYNQMLEEN